ncbi:hypothetical protein DOFOFD_01785 [Acetobacteraceae bacterium EV16P]|uniref:Uncharacterized protein n=1 Tax=Sorlinia euscelidii TaxID=3081148 RepID=A0ABU7TZZ8_9PROT
MTAPVTTSVLQVGQTLDKMFTPILDADVEGEALSTGFEASVLGGNLINLPHSPYGQMATQPHNLVVHGSTIGPFNPGCVLCLFMEPVDGRRAAISAEEYRDGYVSTHDGVMLYGQPANANARLILPVTRYSAHDVTLCTPLTATERAQIHKGMYIVTNSVPEGTVQSAIGTNSTLPAFRNLSGLVAGVSDDGLSIFVYGWATEMTRADGTVPSTTSLDKVWDPGRTTPVIYIGASNKTFFHNAFMSYDGQNTAETGASSLIHAMEWAEIDENIVNEPRDYAVSYHGLTMTTNASSPRKLTDDSYHLLLAGGQRTYIKMDPQWWTIPIMSDPIFVNAVQGPGLKAGSTNMIASFSQSTNTGQNTWQAHHMMRLNFYNTRINDDQSGTDYTNITTNIGVGVDGTSSQLGTMQEHIALNPAEYRNGISLCSYIVCGLNVDRDGLTWHTQDVHVTDGKAVFLGDESKKDIGYLFGRLNPSSGTPDLHIVVPANNQGVGSVIVDSALDVNGEASFASLSVHGAANFEEGTAISKGAAYALNSNAGKTLLGADKVGNIVLTQKDSRSGGGLAPASYSLSSLPRSGPTDGVRVWCSDCLLNGIRGVNAYWHSANQHWTDGQNNVLVN